MTWYVYRASQILTDLSVLALAFVLAYLLRYDWALSMKAFKVAVFALPYVVLLQYSFLVGFGVPRFSWRHVSLREAERVLVALGAALTLLVGARLVAGSWIEGWGYARYAAIPLGVLVTDYIIAVSGIVGVRVLRRIHAEGASSRAYRSPRAERTPTLLIGAGRGGHQVAKEITTRPDLGLRAVGFVDDDRNKQGLVIDGLRVLGTTRDLAAIVARTGAKMAILTFASASGQEVRRVVQLCDETGVQTKIVPELHEIVAGEVALSRMRDVAIEDLLRRDPVVLDQNAVSAHLSGRIVMVTGAGGSIGSELCRQIGRQNPRSILLVERAENALFEIHRSLLETGIDPQRVVPILADICDAERIDQVFSEFQPEIVFHAAAHKHVPMMELHPAEAVKNNIGGTQALATTAHRHRTHSFVMVSTDKAVNPTSVMGVSKRVAEMVVQALDSRSETTFVTVRFGNVLGSTGSVVPIFKAQIARGGPVTVTHPDMTRYFMTIPEACQLVLQAGTMGSGGEIFILDMGDPVRIADLASDLIRLSGFRVGEDVEIVFTGVRPGEKLFEELAVEEELVGKTKHPKIYVGQRRQVPNPGAFEADFTGLLERVDWLSDELIRQALARLVPEYTGGSGLAGAYPRKRGIVGAAAE